MGVTWHCQTYRSKHIVPHNVDYISDGIIPRFLLSDRGTSSSQRASRYLPWTEVVEQYSKRKLTYMSDKLLAIAGIAQEFHTLFPDVYLAGLWKSNLIKQLGWRRTLLNGVQAEDTSTPLLGGIPKWSWASIDQPVSFDPIYTPDAEFVSCEVNPISASSLFGDTTGIRLSLSARLRNIQEEVSNKHIRIVFDNPSFSPSIESAENIQLLLLGFSSHRAPIGLVLTQTNENASERIGYFEALDISDPYTELAESFKSITRKLVTIV